MIECHQLTKRYGAITAIEDVTFTARPGAVTAFLGPNGSGKSTTLRLVLGLDPATAGAALVAGRPYGARRHPLRTVGAHLDGRAYHPGRRARDHLLAIARSNRIPDQRVDAVLAETGLSDVAHRRAGGFSLGMGQRLGIAAALLGDPEVLILDEPANGLDASGIRWVRELVRRRAGAGGTVLLSSHLLREVEVVADDVVIIVGGRIRAAGAVHDLVAGHDDLEAAYLDCVDQTDLEAIA